MNELTKSGEDFRKNKKQVSNAHYYSFKLLCGLVIASVAYIVYKQNSETLEAGIMAIGGTSIMFAFLFNSDKAASWTGAKLIGLFVILWLCVEMFSAFGARVSVSNNHELRQVRENKADSKAELARLVKFNDHILSAGHTPANEAALLASNARAIKQEKKQSKAIVESNEQRLHSDIERMTGVSDIGSIRYGIMAALYILGSSLLIKMSGGLYCNRSLKKHIKQAKETMEIMKSCEATETKSGTSPSLTTQGTQEDKPTVKKTITGNIEQAKVWVKSHKTGEKLSAKALRKATGTSSTSQQNVVISELRKSGLVSKKMNGKVPNYFKAEPKKAALEQIKETGNLISLFKK